MVYFLIPTMVSWVFPSLCSIFFFLLIFSVTVSHSFNKRASQKQSLRNSRLSRRTGVKKKKKAVCSAAVMPNKAAKAAQTAGCQRHQVQA